MTFFTKVQTLTLVLLLLCAVCIAPVLAQDPDQPKNETATNGGWSEGHGWYIDPESGILTKLYREFTFCDDSIGGGYRLPDGARIHYAKGYTVVWDKAGKLIANISDENAGPWFSPNSKHESAHNAPLAIEVPSGSYVFHEKNGDTTIARDLGKTDIISTHSKTFPPSEKGDAEFQKPSDLHTWVAWHEIPITKPISKVSAEWSVGIKPHQPHPKSNENQAFHTFPGIDVRGRVLQPVLSWNWIYDDKTAHRKLNSERNTWSISSHICNGNDIHSPSQQVSAPNSVHGEIIYRSQDPTPHWSITTSQGSTRTTLNEVERTTYPNPPGSNPHVVFTLEKNSFVCYPNDCPKEIRKLFGGACNDEWQWTRTHWPDAIIFKNIVIEPDSSINRREARNVVACTHDDCKKVDVPKTSGGMRQGVTIQFDKSKSNKEENL